MAATDFLMASNVPPHRAFAARRRFAWLKRFWQAERKANYRRRWAVAQRVVDAIKRADPKARVSIKSMQKWEMLYRRFGPPGLVARKPGPKPKVHP